MRFCKKCGSRIAYDRASLYCSLDCSGDVSRNKKHGMACTPEWRCWQNMKRRCNSEQHKDYPKYGGRGITVCDRWMEGFENFIADMGMRPSPKHSLDRINTYGNYEPGNCRWATPLEQTQNRRPYSEWDTKRRKAALPRQEKQP